MTQPPGPGRGLLLLVAAAFFMENLDATIVTTAAPAMARSLHVSAAAIGVAITAYGGTGGAGAPAAFRPRRGGVHARLRRVCAVHVTPRTHRRPRRPSRGRSPDGAGRA